jgi:hypothetical protein
MSHQVISDPGRVRGQLLEAPGDNHVKRRVGEVAELGVKAKRLPSATYDLYVIREDPIDGRDIFKQHPVKVGTYSADVLYGREGSLSRNDSVGREVIAPQILSQDEE